MAKHNLHEPEIEVETSLEEKPRFGIVANCDRLNVRNKPNRSSEVLAVIEEDEEVAIFMSKSTRNWYYVQTESGVKGYSMADYIIRKK